MIECYFWKNYWKYILFGFDNDLNFILILMIWFYIKSFGKNNFSMFFYHILQLNFYLKLVFDSQRFLYIEIILRSMQIKDENKVLILKILLLVQKIRFWFFKIWKYCSSFVCLIINISSLFTLGKYSISNQKKIESYIHQNIHAKIDSHVPMIL